MSLQEPEAGGSFVPAVDDEHERRTGRGAHDRSRNLVSMPAALSRAIAGLEHLMESEEVKLSVCLKDTIVCLHDILDRFQPQGRSQDGPFKRRCHLAWEAFKRGFTLAFFSKAGLAWATRMLAFVRGKTPKTNSDTSLLSAITRSEEAVRLGLFIGGFASLYHVIRGALEQVVPSQEALQCSAPAAIAGLTLLLMPDREDRRTLSLYVAARAAECTYRSLKARGHWKFPGASWPHHDMLLFAASSAQVMYAWVMNPTTIPKSSADFIQKTGPIDKIVVEAVRRNNRGLSVDMKALNEYARQRGARNPPLTSPFPRMIPISLMLHGRSSIRATVQTFVDAFRRTLPLYLSISVVPYTVFNVRRALTHPLSTMWHALVSALRSTTFLSTFVAMYMGSICMHRAFCVWDHKFVYWLAGCFSGLAVLIEKKSRRSELALYVLPRATDSWLQILTQRQWLPDTKLFEILIFGASMAALLRFREKEPETMAPFIKSIITRVVFGGETQSTTPHSLADEGSWEGRAPSWKLSKEDLLGGASLESPASSRGPSSHSAPRVRSHASVGAAAHVLDAAESQDDRARHASGVSMQPGQSPFMRVERTSASSEGLGEMASLQSEPSLRNLAVGVGHEGGLDRRGVASASELRGGVAVDAPNRRADAGSSAQDQGLHEAGTAYADAGVRGHDIGQLPQASHLGLRQLQTQPESALAGEPRMPRAASESPTSRAPRSDGTLRDRHSYPQLRRDAVPGGILREMYIPGFVDDGRPITLQPPPVFLPPGAVFDPDSRPGAFATTSDVTRTYSRVGGLDTLVNTRPVPLNRVLGGGMRAAQVLDDDMTDELSPRLTPSFEQLLKENSLLEAPSVHGRDVGEPPVGSIQGAVAGGGSNESLSDMLTRHSTGRQTVYKDQHGRITSVCRDFSSEQLADDSHSGL